MVLPILKTPFKGSLDPVVGLRAPTARVKGPLPLLVFFTNKQLGLAKNLGLSLKDMHIKEHAEFITVTCLERKHILNEDRFKDIIIDSLSFLGRTKRVCIYGFVIMSNHFHLIWQMVDDHIREEVQRDFLKYTGQQILKQLRNEKSEMLKELLVQTKDRKYQVWNRNSLGIPLWSPSVFNQKLEYIHNNPIKARLCKYPEDYKYSSADFYDKNEKDWGFLVHHEG